MNKRFAASIILLLLCAGYTTKGAQAQATVPVCNYKHLLLIYPNTNVSYVENNSAKTFAGSMSTELKTTIINAFKNLPNLILNGSDRLANTTCNTIEISHPITKLSPLGNDMYWLSSQDIDQDLKQYAPPGTYDSISVVWYHGGYSGVKSYFGLGGVFINNGTTTFTSLIAGETWWWTGLGEAYGEPFLHEWLHGVCRYYQGLGYPMPDQDADGADEHGYTKSSTDGWMPYYRDLMRGRVWEPKLSKYTGITAQAWARATPIPEPTLIYVFAAAAATALIALKTKHQRVLQLPCFLDNNHRHARGFANDF